MATVLVVDDDPEFLQTAERSMAVIGHKALLAVTGSQAKMLLAMLADQIELALVDLVMRTESGLDVIRDLKRSRPHLKVIAVTLHATETDLEIARYLGAEAALRKPVSEEWNLTIAAVLRAASKRAPGA